MTEVYLKLNQQTERFDCYEVLTDEYIHTLTCGNAFMLIPEDDDLEVSGRIEHNSTYGYYWVDSEGVAVEYLKSGMKGYIE